MKNILKYLVIPLSVLLFISCSDSDTETPENPIQITMRLTVQSGADMTSLGEGGGIIAFPKAGGTVKLIISSESSWSYQPSLNPTDWLSVQKDGSTLTLVAQPNEKAQNLSHEITLTAGSGEEAVTYLLDIRLTAQEFVFSPAIAEFSAAGQTIEVNVSVSGNTWNVAESPGWIEVESEGDVLSLTAGRYYGTDDRIDEIIFTSENGPGTLTVVQRGVGATEITIDPVEGLIFAADGEELEATVTTNKQWRVVSDVSWLEITENTEELFKVKAEPNHYAIGRNDFIYVIAGEGDDEVSQRVYIGQEAQPEAAINTEDIALASTSGRYELTIDTNQETWIYDPGDQTWLTATQEGNKLILTYNANTSAKVNAADIKVTVGRIENQAEGTYNIKQLPGSTAQALIYEMEVPAGEEAMLPLYWVTIRYPTHTEISGHVDAIVDWGDGTLENVKDRGYPTHIFSTGGTHEVRIFGEVDMLRAPLSSGFGFEGREVGTDGYRRRGYFTKVLQWGDLGYTQVDYACYYFHNLKYVAGDNNGSFAEVDYLPYMFYGCSSLEEIPGNIFSHISKIRIPELGDTSASFNSIFTLCTSLKKVPAGLFANKPLIHSLSMCFESCTSLEEVEEGAFGSHPNLVSVLRLFQNCTSLKKVPVNIFDGMPNVKTFQWCFYNCRLEGESPYTMVGSEKVRLWERINYPGNFGPPSSPNTTHGGTYGGTFYNCTNLTDYGEIPDFWKAYFSL